MTKKTGKSRRLTIEQKTDEARAGVELLAFKLELAVAAASKGTVARMGARRRSVDAAVRNLFHNLEGLAALIRALPK